MTDWFYSATGGCLTWCSANPTLVQTNRISLTGPRRSGDSDFACNHLTPPTGNRDGPSEWLGAAGAPGDELA